MAVTTVATSIGCTVSGSDTADGPGDRTVPSAEVRGATTLASTTTTSSPTTTTTLPSADDAAFVATLWSSYLAAFDAIASASAVPNPDAPELAAHLTGTMLDHWRLRLAERVRKGLHTRPAVPSLTRRELVGVEVVDARQVTLTVCSLDDAVVAVKATGQVVNDDVVIQRASEYMRLVDGVWKLAGRRGHPAQTGDCPTL